MNNLESKYKTKSYFISFFLFSILTQSIFYQLHELGHYITGVFLGLKQKFIMTGVIVQQDMSSTQMVIHSLGGPIITFTMAVLCLFLFIRYKNTNPLLSTALLTSVYANTILRIQPMATDLITGKINYQDEYKIAVMLGLPGKSLCITSLVVFSLIFITAFIYSGNHKVIKFLLFFIGCVIAAVSINSLAARLFF